MTAPSQLRLEHKPHLRVPYIIQVQGIDGKWFYLVSFSTREAAEKRLSELQAKSAQPLPPFQPQLPVTSLVATLIETFHGTRFDLSNEKAAQAQIAEQLTALRLAFDREPRLTVHDIPDFLIPSAGLVIEVKLRATSKMNVWRQLLRYAEHHAVQQILLVTNLSMGLPTHAREKPVYYCSLGRAWV